MRATRDYVDGHRGAVLRIIQFMQPNCLPSEFKHGAHALLGFQSGMCGAAFDLNREHPRSLPRRLNTSTCGWWFEHQHRLRVLCLSFDERSTRRTASLFVTRQQNRDRQSRPEADGFARAQTLQRDRAVCLHVEDAGTKDSISFGAPRPFLNRAARMNGVGVTENYQAFFTRRVSEGANAQMLAEIFAADSLD